MPLKEVIVTAKVSSDNDDYRAAQIPLVSGKLDHLYGFSVTRQSGTGYRASQENVSSKDHSNVHPT